MRFVSPALKHIIFPMLSGSGMLRYMAGNGPAVVTYHGVFPREYVIKNRVLDGNLVHANSLRSQLRLLKRRYNIVTPEEFLSWCEGGSALPRRSILLTCDDALRNTLTEMVPILREFDVSCLFFATGASANETPSMLWYEELYLMLLEVGAPFTIKIEEAGIATGAIALGQIHAGWWKLVEQLSAFDGEARGRFLAQIREQLGLLDSWTERILGDPRVAARFLMLDRAGLQQMIAAGMTIGAHSLSHPVLAKTSDELAWREISGSRKALEGALGQAVWAFGYPFGTGATVTARDLRLAEEAGFRCAFMNTGGGFGAKTKRFAVPRVHVTADMGVGEFEAHISGFFRWLRRRLLAEREIEAVLGA